MKNMIAVFYYLFFIMYLSPSLPEETFVSVDTDSLQILLSFALAHGGVNTILDVLQILLG